MLDCAATLPSGRKVTSNTALRSLDASREGGATFVTIAFAYATDAVTSVPPFSSVTAIVSAAGAASTVMSPVPFW